MVEVEKAHVVARSPWWSGALLGVVVALAAGVLGMHVLTAGHDAHAAGTIPGGSVVQPVHEHADDAVVHHVDDSRATSLVPTCDSECAAGVAAMCLAVVAAALVVLHRGGGHALVPRRRPFTFVARLLGRRRLDRVGPGLLLLCISRT